MATAEKQNAIAERVERMAALYQPFSDDSAARVCRWLVKPDEAQMVDVFAEFQASDAGMIGDWLVRLETPFADEKCYGAALAAALHEMYEQDRELLPDEGLAADWEYVAPAAGEEDVAAFIRVAESLRSHYGDIAPRLVAYLTPAGIKDVHQWIRWMARYVRAGSPEGVRLMIADVDSQPVFDALAEQFPGEVVVLRPDLDMPGAMEELARQGNPGAPDVAFRQQFVALTNAIGANDLSSARRCSDAALAIASEHGWPAMQIVTQVALGGAYLAQASFAEALTAFRAARQFADGAKAAGDPAGDKLVVQTAMAEGSALFGQQKYAEAAGVYEQAAPVAMEQEDHLSALECWRMAAYCHEQSKAYERAWECAVKALKSGELLEPEVRENATLPYVGQCLQRLTKQKPYRDKGPAVEHRMVELLGKGWERKLEMPAGGGAAK